MELVARIPSDDSINGLSQPRKDETSAFQINQVTAAYEGCILEKCSADLTQFLVPLELSHSDTPLYVRISCVKSFPQTKPTFMVLAKVTHADLHPSTKVLSTQML